MRLLYVFACRPLRDECDMRDLAKFLSISIGGQKEKINLEAPMNGLIPVCFFSSRPETPALLRAGMNGRPEQASESWRSEGGYGIIWPWPDIGREHIHGIGCSTI